MLARILQRQQLKQFLYEKRYTVFSSQLLGTLVRFAPQAARSNLVFPDCTWAYAVLFRVSLIFSARVAAV